MIKTISEYQGELIVLRCWCGIQHAVPASLRKEQVRRHENREAQLSLFCPLGHGYVVSGEPKTAKLERRIENLQGRLSNEQEAHKTTEGQRRAEKGAKTKLKKRIANGVCPCCHRSFQNLMRHMKGQHPDYSDD